MTRPNPVAPTGALRVQPAEEIASLTIHVVTPLFGGADEAGKVDPTRPVNAKSVRGHLRFWWRACKGAAFTTAEELYKAESAIWGNTELPSAVEVSVAITNAGQAEQCARYEKRPPSTRYSSIPVFEKDFPPYALFPFQGELMPGGNDISQQPATALRGLQFTLSIRLARHVKSESAQELAAEVNAALWAWVHFGGVGARTRRGCGTLWCETISARTVQEVQRTAGTFLNILNNEPIITLLSKAEMVTGSATNPMQAWNTAINLLRDFRQKPNIGRNPGSDMPNRPGRSRWPEPDAIRRVLQARCHRHQYSPTADIFFPRADMGLPIVFQFQDERDGCPQATILQGADDRSRMSSPIIIKPLAISQNSAVPMILFLNAPHVWSQQAPEIQLQTVKGHRVALVLKEDQLKSRNKAACVRVMTEQGGGKTYARNAFYIFAQQTLTAFVGRLDGEVKL